MATTLTLSIIVTLLAALHQTTAAQQVHVVGESLGWLVPPGGPIAYATWAATQTFTVGDILVFNFTTGKQDVARVTKEAFDACNSTNPISLQTTGPANFTLSSGGEYYFISTIDRHCPLGQKLALNVTGASGPAASPPPPSPSSTPVPAPSRAPLTYVVGDDLGWLVPPGGSLAYATWASNKAFILGDTLVFNFANGTQDVAVVTKAAYESCDTNTTIAVFATSPVKFALTTPGEYYFTSTYPGHCNLGQKLSVSVTGTSAGPTASPAPIPPPPPPSTTVPTPPRAPVTYVVGDDLGWLVPPGGAIAYSTWAYNKTFIVGDTLVFNFKNGTQDVAVVTKAAYVSCDTNTTITVLTTSPARITLTTPGENYFTSTYLRHCNLGQQLAINVIAASSTSTPPSTTPSTSPTSPSSATTESPVSAPTAGGPIPPPSNSAPSHTMIGFFCVTFLSIATAFLL